ncbi:MAG: HNH endonuclease [Acidobacteriia bacterium]|nr:HNH endonuclease [Terriglobia bacterium]
MKNPNWTREQTLACFNLYCRIPFGKLHSRNPEIIAFANAIGRTASSVAMKLVNLASFDPVHKQRNVRGFANASKLDRALWAEFEAEPNQIAEQSEDAFNRLAILGQLPEEQEPILPEGPTEKQLTRPMRLVQSFFRKSVLASYGYKCSFCALEIRALLNASHIIPWNVSIELRADPRNGFCLCVLHDRAFDRGLMSVGADHHLLISSRVKKANPAPLHRVAFLELEGQRINLPGRFLPDEECLKYHRTSIFE